MPKNEQQGLSSFLESFYGSHTQKNSYLIQKYKEIYDLPTLTKSYTVNPHIFLHCTNIENCVVVVLYNQYKEFFIVYSPTMLTEFEPVGWRLLGGSIHDGKESPEEAVTRTVRREVSCDVAELEPIAYLENHYYWNGNTAVHKGLAFIARSIEIQTTDEDASGHVGLDIKEVVRPKNEQKKFVEKEKIPEPMAFLNKEIMEIAIEKLKSKVFEASEEEINAPKKRNRALNAFHNHIFKPITHKYASRRVRQKLKSYIENAKTIIDVSTGDDSFILDLASEDAHDICVANDIAFAQMSSLRALAKSKDLNILFTSHNLTSLPFALKFDAVLFKNTLHHICNKDECIVILENLKQISKRLIIVDIENPKKSSRKARLFNYYYEEIYGDGADDQHRFHSKDSFRTLINLAFSGAKITHDKCDTIKGVYMIAVIDFIEENG